MNMQQTGRSWASSLLGLLGISGCGPSIEQQAIDALNRGVDYAENGEFDKAIADYTKVIRLNPSDNVQTVWFPSGAIDPAKNFTVTIGEAYRIEVAQAPSVLVPEHF